MGQYIFQPPKAAIEQEITYPVMLEYIRTGRSHEYPLRYRNLGTAARVQHLDIPVPGLVAVRLYETVIALLYPNGAVTITPEVDHHHSNATRWWLSKILSDNGHGGHVYSEGFKYHNGGIPIAGRTYD